MNIGKATSGFMFSVGVNQNLNIEIQIILNIEIWRIIYRTYNKPVIILIIWIALGR